MFSLKSSCKSTPAVVIERHLNHCPPSSLAVSLHQQCSPSLIFCHSKGKKTPRGKLRLRVPRRSFKSPFTVKHGLIECSGFTHIRNKFYTTTDIHTLFQEVDASKITEYRKELGLYNKIWCMIYQDLYIHLIIIIIPVFLFSFYILFSILYKHLNRWPDVEPPLLVWW